MPYAPPAQATSPILPVHSNGRARHRRSYSDAPSGPGAFAPLGVPSRGHGHRTAGTGTLTTTPHGGPKFHFKNDQETSSQSDSESDSDHGSHPYPPVKLKARLSPTLSLSTAGSGNVPFPSSKGSPIKTYSPQLLSPNVHSGSNSSSGTNSPRPNFPRTNSTPIFLSNGKPLKSSLKSSSSSPAISPTHSPAHLRHASAPNTPGPSYSPSPSISTPTTPMTPHKNVHFPREEEGQQLASVRIYSRSARPASISLPLSQSMEDTETETETDREYFRQPSAMSSANFAAAGSSSMPFPRMTKLPARSRSQTLPSGAPTNAPTLNSSSSTSANTAQKVIKKVWELDNLKCSAIPSHSPSVYGNVHLEALTLVSASSSTSPSSTSPTSPTSTGSPQITLRGSLLVRNLAYEKTVAVRFTLDEWETTSEVVAHHVTSLGALPRKFFKAGDGLSSVDADTTTPPTSDDDDDKENKASTTPTWDRFSFQIKLDDYAPSLGSRTLWLVARYSVPHVHTRAHSLDDLATFAAMVSNGSTPGSAASSLSLAMAARRASAGEWEMGMTRMGVVTGQPGEFWDNNGGGNYRVLFRMKEIEVTPKPSLTLDTSVETPTPTQEAVNGTKKAVEVESSDEEEEEEERIRKGGKNELGLRGMDRERKNGGSYAFPITKPSVGTPTITFSPASPPVNSYFPPQPPLAPALSRPTAQQQAQMAKETANARAKTTLQHLRGLSLKNYAAPKVSPPAHAAPPVMQRSRSASPSLEANSGATTAANSIGLGPAPGTQERERSASTGAIPASAANPTGAVKITPSMMNMSVAAESGPGISMLSSSPGMSTSPELMRFGGGGGFGRRWDVPSSTTSNGSTTVVTNDDDKSDTSSTSSNSASETPPLLSPLMSPVVEFSSFAFDHSTSPPGPMSFAGMFGGFPATIVNEPQPDMGAEMDGHYSPYHSRSPGEDDANMKPMRRQGQDSKPQQDSGFSLYWPWGAQRRFDADKGDQGEEERDEHVELVSPSPASNASTITPGTEDGPSPPTPTFKVRQPSPQPTSLRRLVDSHNGNNENKPKRPHSPLSNAALNRAAIKRPGMMSRESSLDSIPELAKAASVSAVPPHITNKPYTSSPLGSPLTSPRGSPRESPHGSRSPSPSEPPLSPGTVATDSAYQAFVKKWCFAQGPGAVSVGDVRG